MEQHRTSSRAGGTRVYGSRAGGACVVGLGLALLGSLGACRTGAPEAPSAPASTDPAKVGADFAVAPVSGPTIVARATERALTPGPKLDPCLGPAALASKLGLHKYKEPEALFKDFPGEFLVPDIATLPKGSEFWEGFFNSGMDGDFRQSTMALTWYIGPPQEKKDPRQPEMKGIMVRPELSIVQMTGRMIPDPPLEAHQRLDLRGQVGYGFNPPFELNQHSLMWKEGCRWISIVAPLPASDLVKIAQSMRRDGQ